MWGSVMSNKIPGPSWVSFLITMILFICVALPLAIAIVLVSTFHKLLTILIDVLNPKGKE